MNITLSWDLFIIVFFAVIMTYTFIIGKKESVKVILSSYAAIITVQAIGNLMQKYSSDLEIVWSSFGLTQSVEVVSMVKLFSFLAIILFLAIRGGFTVEYANEENAIITTALTSLVGFATAGLLLTTLLTYVAGVPLLDVSLTQATTLSPIIQQSQFMQIMIFNQELWFAAPALLLLVIGFVGNQ